MSILQETLAWSNKSRLTIAAGVALFASTSSLSAACFEVDNWVNLDSQEILVDQIESNDTESQSNITESIFEFLKSGLSLVRNNPLKAMTIFLAMQSQGSRLSVPSASAQFAVSNTDQLHFYDMSDPNPVIQLMPMVITGPVTPCNATIVLSDVNAGNLTSTGTGLTQRFEKGTWTAQGNTASSLNRLLASLRMSIPADYDRAFNLSVEVYDVAARDFNKALGTIQIMTTGGGITTTQAPRTPAMMPTIGTNPKVTTTTMSTSVVSTTGSRTQLVVPPITLAPTDESSNTLSNPQDSTDSTVSSLVSSAPSTSVSQTIALTPASKTKILSPTETSQIPLVVPADQPPYAAIGGGVAGGVALLGCIAAVLAAKRGFLCGGAQKSAEGNVQDPEKALRNQYGKIEVASRNGYDPVRIPQARPDNTYDKVVAADLLPESQYDAPQKPMQGFSEYGPGPVEKSPYENVDAPLT